MSNLVPVFFPGDGCLEALYDDDGVEHRLMGSVEFREGVWGREVFIPAWNTRAALGVLDRPLPVLSGVPAGCVRNVGA
jgi:hypothetical protein